MANNNDPIPKRTETNLLDLTVPQKSPPTNRRNHKLKLGSNIKITRTTLITAIFVLLVAGIAYFNIRYRSAQRDIKRLSASSQVSKEQTQLLQDKVGKLVELPQNETPTIATVTDITKIKDQPFFANAQNNDQVLIYTQAKRAVLFRPSTNKVIEVGPVNIGDTNTTSKSR